jgi:predicted amidophosphoribosyltransferase
MVAQQFWGKINLEAAYAMCYFTKGGKMQHLMHQFKYKGIQKIGNMLGDMAGGQLLKSPVFNSVDLIIPVPLHKSRLRKRGYNQSACFAAGLSEKLNVPVDENNLVRVRATETQTHRRGFQDLRMCRKYLLW